MKKKTVFVNLNGSIGDYVSKIYTETTTGDNAIIALKQKLNVTISTMSNLPATEENCKQAWERLTGIVHNAGVKHTEYDAYKEIVNAVDEIGESIAYFNDRFGMVECYLSNVEDTLVDFVNTDKNDWQLLIDRFLKHIMVRNAWVKHTISTEENKASVKVLYGLAKKCKCDSDLYIEAMYYQDFITRQPVYTTIINNISRRAI